MPKIRIFFIEIIDLNGQKQRLKSDDYNKILNFVHRHRGKVNGINMGNRLVDKESFVKIKAEDCFK